MTAQMDFSEEGAESYMLQMREFGDCIINRTEPETGDEDDSWSTVGSSQNIIEASWIALSDSLEYAITRARS